jgi:signal peptidase II
MIADVFNNDILHIYHVRNKVIAFSLGQEIPENFRPLLFIVLPLCVLAFLLYYFFKSPECTQFQRWAIAGITGGGLGNLIDRMFRPEGVVDFISVKFFGIFGFERWPTFNISDAAVVVGVILWLISMFADEKSKFADEKSKVKK